MPDTIKVEFIPAKHWYHRAKWKLLEDYTSNNGKVNAPAGFITDGASIPFFARRWFSPTGRYFGAAIVHDYVLVSEGNWKKANEEFDKEMRALAIDSWRRYIILGAVTAWGWIKR